ncbi:MAG TPA: hypothetical protein PLO53_12100, partial [Candidatus Hydrogenedentes bacterium]|nr:hypothetical protein [Candidatus Hydrogenedentota bacterium]
MRHTWRGWVLPVCLLVAAAVLCAEELPPDTASAPEDSSSLRLGVLINQGQDQGQAMWEPTAAYLSEHLDRPVRLVPLPFEAVELAAQNKTVDLLTANSGI